MNWVGGARNRIKRNQEQKVQREFFKKRKLQSANDSRIQDMAVTPSLSRDLLTFNLLQIKSREDSKKAKPVKVIYHDLEKVNKGKTIHADIPETPLHSSKLVLAKNDRREIPDLLKNYKRKLEQNDDPEISSYRKGIKHSEVSNRSNFIDMLQEVSEVNNDTFDENRICNAISTSANNFSSELLQNLTHLALTSKNETKHKNFYGSDLSHDDTDDDAEQNYFAESSGRYSVQSSYCKDEHAKANRLGASMKRKIASRKPEKHSTIIKKHSKEKFEFYPLLHTANNFEQGSMEIYDQNCSYLNEKNVSSDLEKYYDSKTSNGIISEGYPVHKNSHGHIKSVDRSQVDTESSSSSNVSWEISQGPEDLIIRSGQSAQKASNIERFLKASKNINNGNLDMKYTSVFDSTMLNTYNDDVNDSLQFRNAQGMPDDLYKNNKDLEEYSLFQEEVYLIKKSKYKSKPNIFPRLVHETDENFSMEASSHKNRSHKSYAFSDVNKKLKNSLDTSQAPFQNKPNVDGFNIDNSLSHNFANLFSKNKLIRRDKGVNQKLSMCKNYFGNRKQAYEILRKEKEDGSAYSAFINAESEESIDENYTQNQQCTIAGCSKTADITFCNSPFKEIERNSNDILHSNLLNMSNKRMKGIFIENNSDLAISNKNTLSYETYQEKFTTEDISNGSVKRGRSPRKSNLISAFFRNYSNASDNKPNIEEICNRRSGGHCMNEQFYRRKNKEKVENSGQHQNLKRSLKSAELMKAGDNGNFVLQSLTNEMYNNNILARNEAAYKTEHCHILPEDDLVINAINDKKFKSVKMMSEEQNPEETSDYNTISGSIYPKHNVDKVDEHINLKDGCNVGEISDKLMEANLVEAIVCEEPQLEAPKSVEIMKADNNVNFLLQSLQNEIHNKNILVKNEAADNTEHCDILLEGDMVIKARNDKTFKSVKRMFDEKNPEETSDYTIISGSIYQKHNVDKGDEHTNLKDRFNVVEFSDKLMEANDVEATTFQYSPSIIHDDKVLPENEENNFVSPEKDAINNSENETDEEFEIETLKSTKYLCEEEELIRKEFTDSLTEENKTVSNAGLHSPKSTSYQQKDILQKEVVPLGKLDAPQIQEEFSATNCESTDQEAKDLVAPKRCNVETQTYINCVVAETQTIFERSDFSCQAELEVL